MTTTPLAALPRTTHLPALDGLRGIAALWVLLFHTQLLSGMSPVPLLSYGALAVDLFMLISGLLMTHHYLLRRASEPWESPKTWCIFWLRRFLRIAPLYYVLLALALILGPTLGDNREWLGLTWPQAGTELERYTDQSPANIVTHVTFLFGLLPGYSFKTPLPDWSIGLEMQFYAVFPFLMLLVLRLGLHRAMLAVVLASALLYLSFPVFFAQFELPSALPMKLYMFVSGILIAIGRHRDTLRRSLLMATAFAFAVCVYAPSPESALRIGMIVAVFYLFHEGALPSHPALEGLLARIRRVLGSAPGHFLGEISYSVYLVHLLVLIPVAAYLLRYEWYVAGSGALRFGTCLLIALPVIYGLSALAHLLIEQPGIRYGKKLAVSLRMTRLLPA